MRTNFERITESPESLAEILVYHEVHKLYGDVWFGLSRIENTDMRMGFPKKEDAIAATLKYLREERNE